MDVDIKCPYCWHDNSFEIEWEDLEQEWVYNSDCENCNKTFWTIMKLWDWYFDDEAIELPCTNWEWHNYDTTIHYGDHSTKRCSECWKEEHPYSEFKKAQK